jgi:gliding motility-associated protein GldM
MYLVLTALLALNVSKEVLNSFFEINKGIERTTNNFNSKNQSTYAAFDNAASNNPEKYQSVRDLAYSLKTESDNIIFYIQEMKFNLVNKADGKVFLGNESDVLDEEGKPKEGTELEGINFSDLNSNQKTLPIAYLRAKSDRYASSLLFLDKKVGKSKQIAYVLSKKILEYRDELLEAVPNNANLINTINQVCDVSKIKKNDGTLVDWEKYNFNDMPAVSALTILSKVQSDMRNIEADVIDYLKRDIDSKSLKFTSAEGIQIPQSNFVLRGDSFRSSIFISAKQDGQDPEIFVGEYDSIGGGLYKMTGEYETVKVVNGKGIFSKRETTEGIKKYGGLIAMKTETGTKMYPFNGEYLVAAKTAVVSPTKMNILYSGLEAIGGNPIQISVPGYTAGEISPSMTNGTLKVSKKSEGLYNAFPAPGKSSAVITLFADVDGKRTNMGKVEFRIRKTPPASPVIKSVDENGMCDRAILKTEIVQATLDNFLFDGLKYRVTSFKLSGSYKGQPASDEQKNGMGFTPKMQGIIANSSSGSTINITKIRAKLIGSNRPSEAVKGDLVIEIK